MSIAPRSYGLGNHVTVYAATNPTPQGREPAALHDSMPGYGIVRFAKETGEITMECWPRYANPETDAPYPGWPRTIHWLDNDGREPAAFLPTLRLGERADVVVQKSYFHYRWFFGLYNRRNIAANTLGATSLDNIRTVPRATPLLPFDDIRDWRPHDALLRSFRTASAPSGGGAEG